MSRQYPLECVACGGRFFGPAELIGTSCRHIRRPAGAVDVFQTEMQPVPDNEPF